MPEWRRDWRLALAGAGFWLALVPWSAPAAAADLHVVVTMKPIHALVAEVMVGVGEPALLVKGSASPHTFALKPSDAGELAGANLFFRVSESVEPFTRRALALLPPDARTVSLADVPGIALLDREADAHSGEHEHGEGLWAGAHGKDRHVWLDPENAKVMLGVIAAALSDLAPEHRAAFEANAAAAKAALDDLEREVVAAVAPARGKPYAVFHDAYRYFASRFGLEPGLAISVSPEVTPSAKRLAEVRAALAAASSVCVFTEPFANPAVIAAVTEGTSTKSGTLDPEGLTVAPGKDAYAATLRGLAKGFRDCFGAQ